MPNCGILNAEVQLTSMGFVTGLALAENPTFLVNKCAKFRLHLLSKQMSSFWPFSSLTFVV